MNTLKSKEKRGRNILIALSWLEFTSDNPRFLDLYEKLAWKIRKDIAMLKTPPPEKPRKRGIHHE